MSFLRRDGPDQSSPQIGQFSGNTALESVYSTSNIILIKFHSDFSGAGFFVLSYHGEMLKTLSTLLHAAGCASRTLPYIIWYHYQSKVLLKWKVSRCTFTPRGDKKPFYFGLSRLSTCQMSTSALHRGWCSLSRLSAVGSLRDFWLCFDFESDRSLPVSSGF